jgi:hypothetical protein
MLSVSTPVVRHIYQTDLAHLAGTQLPVPGGQEYCSGIRVSAICLSSGVSRRRIPGHNSFSAVGGYGQSAVEADFSKTGT